MCTVVYVPDGEKRILASLRDESPLRPPAIPPRVIDEDEVTYIMPIDPYGNGSWVGFNDNRSAIILLNGAFIKHKHNPPYEMSRGLIVRKLLANKMPVIEWMLTPMEGLEPYTLVVFTDGQLFRLTWDGEKKYRETLDKNASHIFSSSTLYEMETAKNRKDYFDDWIAMRPPINRLSLLNFFNSVDDQTNGFIIDRPGSVKTLSYSYIELGQTESTICYYDLLKFEVHISSL